MCCIQQLGAQGNDLTNITIGSFCGVFSYLELADTPGFYTGPVTIQACPHSSISVPNFTIQYPYWGFLVLNIVIKLLLAS